MWVNLEAPTIGYGPTAAPVGYHRLHPDRGFEFQLNRFLECIGPSALPEIRDAAKEISTYGDWVDTFLRLAAAARSDGRVMAAACYDRAAEFFMTVEDARRGPARARFLHDMRSLYQLSAVPVSYRDSTLPAYDLQPDRSPRGTVVVFGGFDSYIEEFFPLLLAGVIAGYRMVAFDGPGQGGALEDSGLAMTPEWERPVSAVLDHFGLDDVTLVGISLGGGLAIRAAAFEPRVSRVVALDILDDFLECLGRQIFPGSTTVLRLLLAARARPILNAAARAAAARKPLAAWGLRQGMHVTASPDPYEFMCAARELSTRRVSARVTADALLLGGADDHYVAVHQLYRQAGTLVHARSVSTRLFTQAEQAQNHCQVGNIGLALRVILGWIESHQSISLARG
jgi:pimeloyl-ACP methyl ester carboxylesterase